MSKRADERERRTGMRQSIGAMIIKLFLGALFIIAALDMDIKEEAAAMFIGVALGAAMLAWALLPLLRARKHKAALMMEDSIAYERSLAAEDRAHRRADQKLRHEEFLNKPRVCPACGATSRGTVCEYCGTSLIDSDGNDVV